MFCSKCGQALSEGDVFCQSCGTKVWTDQEKETPVAVSEEKPATPAVVKIAQTAPVEAAPKAVEVVEKPTARPAQKKKRKKIVIVTIIILLVAAIAAAVYLWMLQNFWKCSMCGDIVRNYDLHIVGSISEDHGTYTTGGSSLVCEYCAPGYGGEGFTFYTHIDLESTGYDEDENLRFYEWYNDDKNIEIEVMTVDIPGFEDKSEEEKDAYATDCIIDSYGEDIFGNWGEYIAERETSDSMFGGYAVYTDYYYEESEVRGVVICTRDYERIYMFEIFSDDSNYLDALEGSILGIGNY